MDGPQSDLPAVAALPAQRSRRAAPDVEAPGTVEDEHEERCRRAATEERRRLARELHDSVSSVLFALHARAQVVHRALAAGDHALLAAAAEDVQLLSGQALAELRSVVGALRDDALPSGTVTSDAGPALQLPAGLRRLAATARSRDGVDVRLRVASGLPEVPPATVEHLLRIAAEAVHNCHKHAGAPEVRVELEVRGSELVLTVADEGCGFDPSAVTGDGHGQRTMRERAVLCGGWLHVDSAAGRGTRVVARVPLPG